MPCAMSSLRGASGVVGCDRVVCPLVLHATTIAHLDVLLCTLLCFLLCAVLLCGAVPLSCGAPCVLPALPVVRLRGAVAVVCECFLPPALLAPAGVCYGAPCTPCALPALFSRNNTCPIYGVLYVGLVRSLYTCPIFRLAIYNPFCTHSKSRPLDSECGFPKVGLNFRCSIFFLFAELSPVKFPA
jgi:hypothetical protein